MCEVLCHWLPLCQIPDWIWEFRKLVISKWQNWWWYLCIIGFHRNEQAMPFGWLMLYILRGYKNSISKVGTRCEEAEVQRNESLAPDRNTCECGAQQIYGKLVTFRFFIEYVSAALLYTEDAGTCVSHAVPECTQDLQIHGGSVWSINKYLSKYLSVKKQPNKANLKNYWRMYVKEHVSMIWDKAAWQQIETPDLLAGLRGTFTSATLAFRSKCFTVLWMVSRLFSLPFSTSSFQLKGVVQGLNSLGKPRMNPRPCYMQGEGVNFKHDFKDRTSLFVLGLRTQLWEHTWKVVSAAANSFDFFCLPAPR